MASNEHTADRDSLLFGCHIWPTSAPTYYAAERPVSDEFPAVRAARFFGGRYGCSWPIAAPCPHSILEPLSFAYPEAALKADLAAHSSCNRGSSRPKRAALPVGCSVVWSTIGVVMTISPAVLRGWPVSEGGSPCSEYSSRWRLIVAHSEKPHSTPSGAVRPYGESHGFCAEVLGVSPGLGRGAESTFPRFSGEVQAVEAWPYPASPSFQAYYHALTPSSPQPSP